MIRNLIATVLAALALNAFAAVDANQASRADLETVKGIGPGLSGKIVQARQTGAFKDWNDLVERISGIGPANAARFSGAGLTVAGSAYSADAAPARAAKVGRAKTEKTEKTERTSKAAKAAGPAAPGAQPKVRSRKGDVGAAVQGG